MPKWLQIVLHILVIAGGVAGSIKTGSTVPLVASSAVNALIKSPLSANNEEEHLAAAEKARAERSIN